jgi:hypothetical protein
MSFYYLATPYTKYPHGHEAAAKEAARIAGELLRRGMIVYSPIAHSHQLAVEAKLPETGFAYWMAADAPFMAAADRLIVATMDGWRDSVGVAHEAMFFDRAGKRMYTLDPSTLRPGCDQIELESADLGTLYGVNFRF